ncbi:membrane protein [Mycobacterium bourgelatii]|uniref:Membrane protein n=1 Tax=Mycobacterium bourgelatii TaxID=1273442 RepID=A0A7I9YIF3_MYCBU|nr:membrane protein [Mycobacterium bourgelatii]
MSGRYGVRERRERHLPDGSTRPPTWLADLYQRAQIWTIGSDPGLLRLRLAIRTTAALGCSLLVMSLVTRAEGQPLTVALLGALITMIAARSVNEPDPRQQRITMALLPLPAALSIAAAALLTPYRLASDFVFVVIVFAAVYIRRFGPRGRAFGMVAFMAYFFTLYLRAGVRELPWMVAAVVVGTVCTFVMTAYVLPDRPERVLRATIRSLRARMAIVVDTTAEALRAGRLDERRRRRIRARIARLNDTALMVQSQIEDEANPARLGPGIGDEALTPWLFDAELAVEWVAIAGQRATLVAAEIPAATRAELAATLTQLARAIRLPRSGALHDVASHAQQVLDAQPPIEPGSEESGVNMVRRLASAIIAAATATSEVRALLEHPDSQPASPPERDVLEAPPADVDTDHSRRGLLPTTRQAIQASVAGSLAIVLGDRISPERWYWAVIAAFLVFAGTTTWAESLTKGWQRLLGTVLGVPCGMAVATLVAGNSTASLVMIFVCLFCAFYFMQVAQSLMAFWITTVLALLYGLLGQFSVEVLVLRIEETAVGAAIGVAVAILLLPTTLSTTIRKDTREFLSSLSLVIETSIARMFGQQGANSPTEEARELDRKLQQFRITAKPLLAGVTGLAGRHNIQHSLRLFTICDRYGRNLARNGERYVDPSCPAELAEAVRTAARQIQHNIDALVAALDGRHAAPLIAASDALETAETLAAQRDGSGRQEELLRILRSLRRIERAVVATTTHLDADAGLKLSKS